MAEHKLNSKRQSARYVYTTIASLAGDQPMEFKNSIMIVCAIKRKYPIMSVNSNLPPKQSVGEFNMLQHYSATHAEIF